MYGPPWSYPKVVSPLPDVAAESCVWVHGTNPSNGACRRAVLRHLHMVPGPGETWRFVCIQYSHSDGGTILKGATAQEPWVNSWVHHLHGEGI